MKKVLIVEDDEILRKLVKDVIDDGFGDGVLVVMASNAGDALHEFAESVPALVITDLNMEVKNAGLWLAEKIKAATDEVPVILMSGDTVEQEDLEKVDEFLHKPFEPDELVRKVAKLLKM